MGKLLNSHWPREESVFLSFVFLSKAKLFEKGWFALDLKRWHVVSRELKLKLLNTLRKFNKFNPDSNTIKAQNTKISFLWSGEVENWPTAGNENKRPVLLFRDRSSAKLFEEIPSGQNYYRQHIMKKTKDSIDKQWMTMVVTAYSRHLLDAWHVACCSWNHLLFSFVSLFEAFKFWRKY